MKTIFLTISMIFALACSNAQSGFSPYAIDTIAWDTVGNPTMFLVIRPVQIGDLYKVTSEGVEWQFEMCIFAKGVNFNTGTPIVSRRDYLLQPKAQIPTIYSTLTGTSVKDARRAFLNVACKTYINYYNWKELF